MTVAGGFAQDEFQAGGGAHDGVTRDADFLSDFIRGLEADAGNVAREKIRILADALDGTLAVGFVDADGARGAYSMRVEENHDLANDLLFGPGVLDFAARSEE